MVRLSDVAASPPTRCLRSVKSGRCDKMVHGRLRWRPTGGIMARKDKGGKSSKKAATRSLKEKRQAKKVKKAGDTNKPL